MEHYVYLHRRADTGDIFYVGKGVRNRAWDRAGRNPDWHATVAVGGLVVEPIAYFHEHADAIAHEKATIHELGLWEPLVNRSCGGEGAYGWKATPEMLAAMSVRSKALHEDPTYKAKMARVYADPEYIAKQKARYTTPESREAQRALLAKHHDKWLAGMGPEVVARMEKKKADKAAKKAFWAAKREAKAAEALRRKAAHQEKLAEWARTRAEREREGRKRYYAKKHESGEVTPMAQFQADRKARALVAEEARKAAQKARADAKKEATKIRAKERAKALRDAHRAVREAIKAERIRLGNW